MSNSTKSQTRFRVPREGRLTTNVAKSHMDNTPCHIILAAANIRATPPADVPVLFIAAARGVVYAFVKERTSHASQGLRFCWRTRIVQEKRRERQIAEEMSFIPALVRRSERMQQRSMPAI